MGNGTQEASAPIIYGVSPSTPVPVVEQFEGALIRYHRRIRSKSSKRDMRLRAILTCAYLERGHAYRKLGEKNGVPKSTRHTLIHEGIKVLARRAPPLTEVVRPAKAAGFEYLIVDGIDVPTERSAANPTNRRHRYSGKHKRHGGSVATIAAPDGESLWVSGVPPGKTVDTRAGRRFGIAEKVLSHLGLLADLGYIGLDPAVITGPKRKRGHKTLNPATKAANRLQSELRCVGERANAQLKCWKSWPRTSAAVLDGSPRSSRPSRPCSTGSATHSTPPKPSRNRDPNPQP